MGCKCYERRCWAFLYHPSILKRLQLFSFFCFWRANIRKHKNETQGDPFCLISGLGQTGRALGLWISGKLTAFQCVRLFETPWTVARQAPLSTEFSRQEYCSRLPFPSPGDLPHPGIEPRSPTMQADSLPSEPPSVKSALHHLPAERPQQRASGPCHLMAPSLLPQL